MWSWLSNEDANNLFEWPAEQIAPLFEHMQPAGVGQTGNFTFCIDKMMLAPNSANRGGYKVASLPPKGVKSQGFGI